MLTSLAQYGPANLSNNDVLSTIIVLGFLLSIVVNVLVNLWALTVWAFRKDPMNVPRWLLIVNFMFLLLQLLIFIFHQ